MPHRETTQAEERWIRQFERVCKAQPKSLAVFVASGSVCVLLATPEGQLPHGGPNGEGVNPDELITNVQPGGVWDGGDW